MDASIPIPILAVRSSNGVELRKCSSYSAEADIFHKDERKSCRTISFSKDGNLFAWANGQMVNILSLTSAKLLMQLPLPKTACLQFSPLGNICATWELYSANKEDPTLSSNLKLWDIKTQKCIRKLIQKKQSGWAPQWSDDELICARNVNNEVQFFENNDFDKIVKKIHIQKVSEFKLSHGPPPYHVACFVPGTSSGQPSYVRVYCYPNVEGTTAAIANKSFFRADRVEMKWNPKGTGILILAVSDVDKTGASYYGEQKLHYINTSGESSVVQLAKDGPVYSVEWHPNSSEFCVVYGFMPAKSTIFNLKCEPVFDFGTGPRNEIHYSNRGHMLILAGFGNLRGNVEVWDLKKRNRISQITASDTTCLSWSPDSEHFLTATTSPRLRVGNGYKIWHYSGQEINSCHCDKDEELYDAVWQPISSDNFPKKELVYSNKVVQNVTEAPQVAVYRPPAARGQPSSFKIRDDYEPPSNKQQQNENLSKNALKNKKKREAKKGKKEPDQMPSVETVINSEVPVSQLGQLTLTGDADIDKKLRNLQKKLDQIQKLKEQQAAGKQLELNQVEKIKKESEIISEMKKLRVE